MLLSLFVVGLGDMTASTFGLHLTDPNYLILVRTLMLLLVAGAGLTWRAQLSGHSQGRLRATNAIAGAMAPFLASLCLVIVAMAGIATGLRYGVGVEDIIYTEVMTATLRFTTEGLVALVILPFSMMVLEKLRVI